MLGDDKKETVQLRRPDGSTVAYTFNLEELVEYIFGYAGRNGITLPDEADAEDAAELLLIPTREDPWNTGAAFRAYEKLCGRGNGEQGPRIGGDKLDITIWNPFDRMRASFTGRDPLAREIEGIRLGLVMKIE